MSFVAPLSFQRETQHANLHPGELITIARVSFIESKPTNIQLFQLCRLEPLMRWWRISKNSICGPQAGRRSVPADESMD